jgi:hypothetical protein
VDFLAFSATCIQSYMNGFFLYYLPELFGLSEADAIKLAPTFANGWKAYFAGDEKMSSAERKNINLLVQSISPSLVSLLNNI